jgi:Tol biopolymer transport system component
LRTVIENESWSPSWSPSGRQIAFVGIEWRYQIGIYIVNADGSGLVRLARWSSSGGHNPRPAWSPDGKRLAFAHGDGDWEIFVMNADGSAVRRLTDNDGPGDQCPTWSPDGRATTFHTHT